MRLGFSAVLGLVLVLPAASEATEVEPGAEATPVVEETVAPAPTAQVPQAEVEAAPVSTQESAEAGEPVDDSVRAPVEASVEPGAVSVRPPGLEARLRLLGEPLPLLELPPMEPGLLGRGTSFRIIAAAFDAESQGIVGDEDNNETMTAGISFDTRTYSSLEYQDYGGSIELSAGELFGANVGTGDTLWRNEFNTAGIGEVRYYLVEDVPVFFHVTGELDLVLTSTRVEPRANAWDSIAPGRLGLAAGVGAGRVLAVDPRVRLQRLERSLRRHGLLDSALDATTGSDLIRTWYALRNEVGTYPLLVHTLQHLEAVGRLRGTPDLRSVYEAQQVLGDPLIVDRREGWDVRAGVGVVKSFVGFDERDEDEAELAVLASAQVELPRNTTDQISLRLKFLYELGESASRLRPWSLRGFADYSRAYYNDTLDPLGTLAIGGELGISGLRDDLQRYESGVELRAHVAYSAAINRGSLATVSCQLVARNNGEYIGSLNAGVTWGIAGGFMTPYAVTASSE